ncbi:hypothetical protein PG984_003547 [Apiospora sp. TS-2023a]
MDDQRSVESGLVAPSRTLDVGSQANIPALLGIPRELRDQIYGYFVTSDTSIDHESEDDYVGAEFDFTILHINRQIRTEAWDYLIESNIWVCATLPSDTRDDMETMSSYVNYHGTNWPPQPYFPYHSVPAEYAKRLRDEVAIRLSFNESIGSNDEITFGKGHPFQSVIFAYHPLMYGLFIQDFALLAQGWPIAIHVSPSTIQSGSNFRKLLEPLRIFRDVSKVHFRGYENCPALQSLSEDMERPFLTASNHTAELLTIQHHFHHHGRTAELEARYSDAICQYRLGLWASLFYSIMEVNRNCLEGSPEANERDYMRTDLAIGYSRSVHKYITRLRKISPTSNLHDCIDSIHIGLSIRYCDDALKYVGLTDIQRRDVHLYRAFAFVHQAEYSSALPDTQRSGRYKPPSWWYAGRFNGQKAFYKDRGKTSYMNAEFDLFYANQVDASYNILENLDEDDRATYRKIKPLSADFAFVEVHEVPLLGSWSGDPLLWSSWHWELRIMMKLFRQQRITGLDGEAEELRAQYAYEGITWDYSDDGTLRVDEDVGAWEGIKHGS